MLHLSGKDVLLTIAEDDLEMKEMKQILKAYSQNLKNLETLLK